MARKNRVSVPDGIYHVTTRIVNRELWFSNPTLKDLIVGWIYGIAEFSGVNLLSWSVLDNHLHLYVHIPIVPKKYWKDPAVEPAAYAFGMRPPESRQPLWTTGDSPHSPPITRTRPPTDFELTDEEMLSRLSALYGDERRIAALRRNWETMRKEGNGASVDAIKDGYCRRMYNLTQFMKTLKERIAENINRVTHHVGHVFEGRFHSSLVEPEESVQLFVSLYVDYNPYKAHLVREGEFYKWSSFGQACGHGRYARLCQAAYERIWGRPWKEVREVILGIFRSRLSEGLEKRTLSGKVKTDIFQLVKMRLSTIMRGAFVGRSIDFGRKIAARLGHDFPCPSYRSLLWFEECVDWPPCKVRPA